MAHVAIVKGGVRSERRATPSFAFGKLNLLIALLGALFFCVAYLFGFASLALVFLLGTLPLVMLAARGWRGLRGDLEYGLLRRPFDLELRAHLLQCLNHWFFLALVTAAFLLGLYAPFALSLTDAEYLALRFVLWGGLVVLAALALVPRRRVYVATNVLVVLASIFLAVQVVRINLPPDDAVVIDSPLAGEWYVVHGGRSELFNGGHYLLKAQRDALDLVKVVNGRSHQGDQHRLASYAAWGQAVSAPADGRVTSATDHLPDQPIGKSDAVDPLGNQLVIDIGGGRHVMMAHLKQGSVLVSEGDRVRRGQLIAQVGNSGQSDEPHLHLQVQNEPTFDLEQSSYNKPWYLVTNTVIGVGSLRTFPILFRDIVHTRRGEKRTPVEADVRRADRIRRVDSS